MTIYVFIIHSIFQEQDPSPVHEQLKRYAMRLFLVNRCAPFDKLWVRVMNFLQPQEHCLNRLTLNAFCLQ